MISDKYYMKKYNLEEKDVFCKQIGKLLNYGGMGNVNKIYMSDCSISLFSPFEMPVKDKVTIKYNYFEDNYRNSSFDIDSCLIYSDYTGSLEFYDIIIAVFTFYEVSYGKMYDAYDREFINPCKYIGWINHILGTSFTKENLLNIWEFAEEIANSELRNDSMFYINYHIENDIEGYYLGHNECKLGGTEYSDLLYIIHGTESLMTEEILEGTYPYDVKKCREAVKSFLDEHKKNELWKFLAFDYKKREKEKRDFLKEIAELSLFMPAKVFLYLAEELSEKKEFWIIWKKLKNKVYKDEQMKQYASEEIKEWRKQELTKPIPPVLTADFLQQHDDLYLCSKTSDDVEKEPDYILTDDDRLYWWDGTEEVKLSKETDRWLKELAKQHRKIMKEINEDKTAKEFRKEFTLLIAEIDGYYKQIYPFEDMYYEFIQNWNRKEYWAAVELLRRIAESEEFKRQGESIKNTRYSEWELEDRKITHNKARLMLKRYLSVMANEALRKKYFSF